MSEHLSPEVGHQAIEVARTFMGADLALRQTQVDVEYAGRLAATPGVAFEAGSAEALTELHEQAQVNRSVAESMLPNFLDAPLENYFKFDAPTAEAVEAGASGEQKADLREQLLSTFASGYETYGVMLDAKNSKLGRGSKIEKISEADALKKIERALTPEVLEEVAVDIEASDDTRAGFDIEILDGKANTKPQEDAMAETLQAEIPYDGKPYVNENYHNGLTAAKAEPGDEQIRIRLMPRHANVPSDTAKHQKQGLEAKNAGSNVTWRSPNDEEAMAHANILNRNGDLETADETRFWRTFSRQVENYQEDETGAPVDQFVPLFCVDVDGRVVRGRSHVGRGSPSRALVVLNSNL